RPRPLWTSTGFRQAELAHMHLLIDASFVLFTVRSLPGRDAPSLSHFLHRAHGVRAMLRSTALDADRSTASDACMLQLATLACSVDRVASHAGVLGALGNGQPGPHGPSVQVRAFADRENEL